MTARALLIAASLLPATAVALFATLSTAGDALVIAQAAPDQQGKQRPDRKKQDAQERQEKRDQRPQKPQDQRVQPQQRAPEQPAQAQPPKREQPRQPAATREQQTPQRPAQQPVSPQKPATAQQPPQPQQPPATQKPSTATPTQIPPQPQRPTVQQPAQQPLRGAPDQPQQPAVTGPAQPPRDQRSVQKPQRLEDVKRERREERQGDRTIIREGDRTIVREGGRTIIRHSEVERFRSRAQDVRTERLGNDTATVVVRPGGVQIISVYDREGRLIRRSRRGSDGREIVLIDNRPRVSSGTYFVTLPPPVIRIPRERYIVEVERARPDDIFWALLAPPVERLPRAYSLDEIRYSYSVRERMPRIDLDTINFDTGSWEITPGQIQRLAIIADGIRRALDRNPAEVFLVEGHTDAVGSEEDNLSLSDRRAESVAMALTDEFGIPPENLVTQGYGEQYLKIPTSGPERANRRVTIRRITPLLAGEG
jgi:outer membrane protein OmpA-like peptidoglycan-associated protein